MVAVGLAIGCANAALLRPVVGNHEYVLPAIETLPIVALVVVQFTFCVEPASAVGGKLSTLTVTLLVAVQPFIEVTVMVYIVVDGGFAIGCGIEVKFKPSAGDHEY